MHPVLWGVGALAALGVTSVALAQPPKPKPKKDMGPLERFNAEAWRLKGAAQGAVKGVALGHLAYVPAAGVGIGLGGALGSFFTPAGTVTGGWVGAQAVGSAGVLVAVPVFTALGVAGGATGQDFLSRVRL